MVSLKKELDYEALKTHTIVVEVSDSVHVSLKILILFYFE